jgi:hypothetical protein
MVGHLVIYYKHCFRKSRINLTLSLIIESGFYFLVCQLKILLMRHTFFTPLVCPHLSRTRSPLSIYSTKKTPQSRGEISSQQLSHKLFSLLEHQRMRHYFLQFFSRKI